MQGCNQSEIQQLICQNCQQIMNKQPQVNIKKELACNWKSFSQINNQELSQRQNLLNYPSENSTCTKQACIRCTVCKISICEDCIQDHAKIEHRQFQQTRSINSIVEEYNYLANEQLKQVTSEIDQFDRLKKLIQLNQSVHAQEQQSQLSQIKGLLNQYRQVIDGIENVATLAQERSMEEYQNSAALVDKQIDQKKLCSQVNHQTIVNNVDHFKSLPQFQFEKLLDQQEFQAQIQNMMMQGVSKVHISTQNQTIEQIQSQIINLKSAHKSSQYCSLPSVEEFNTFVQKDQQRQEIIPIVEQPIVENQDKIEAQIQNDNLAAKEEQPLKTDTSNQQEEEKDEELILDESIEPIQSQKQEPPNPPDIQKQPEFSAQKRGRGRPRGSSKLMSKEESAKKVQTPNFKTANSVSVSAFQFDSNKKQTPNSKRIRQQAFKLQDNSDKSYSSKSIFISSEKKETFEPKQSSFDKPDSLDQLLALNMREMTEQPVMKPNQEFQTTSKPTFKIALPQNTKKDDSDNESILQLQEEPMSQPAMKMPKPILKQPNIHFSQLTQARRPDEQKQPSQNNNQSYRTTFLMKRLFKDNQILSQPLSLFQAGDPDSVLPNQEQRRNTRTTAPRPCHSPRTVSNHSAIESRMKFSVHSMKTRTMSKRQRKLLQIPDDISDKRSNKSQYYNSLDVASVIAPKGIKFN